MGWLYPYGANRNSLIEDRTNPWERQAGEMLVRSECIKHCFRGGSFRVSSGQKVTQNSGRS